MDSDDEDFDGWHSLFLKCINVEKDFYANNFVPGITTEMHWWPYFQTSKILEKIYDRNGKDKFIIAAQVVFYFPEGIRVEESKTVVDILETMVREGADQRATEILRRLFERNPSKYWDRRKSRK
jgi:hypothetical protein